MTLIKPWALFCVLDNVEMYDKYMDFLMNSSIEGVCDGDSMLKAMEEGVLFDEFILHNKVVK